jgi:hypothetical protein
MFWAAKESTTSWTAAALGSWLWPAQALSTHFSPAAHSAALAQGVPEPVSTM